MDEIDNSKGPLATTSPEVSVELIEELKRANRELREARKAALNLMEDAILSKEALRQSEEKYRIRLEQEVHDRTAELKTSNDLLQATMDASPDMIQVFEAVRNEKGEIIDFRYVLLNHEAEKWMPAATGKLLLRLQPGVVKEGIFDAFKEVVETGVPQQYEKHYVHEQFNGWYHQSVVKLHDGVVTTTADITQRKEAEEQLKAAKERLQITLDSSLYHIQVFKAVRDAQGKIIDFEWILTNRKWNEEYGDVIGKSLLQLNPGVVETGLFGKFVQVTETGIVVDHEQYYSHEQFREQWFHQTLVKMDDGFVMNAVDITERKRAAAEILRLKDEIAQKASDKYKVLFDSIDEGFAIQEVITDEEGNVTDLVYREVNEAFEQHTGMRNALGKKVSDFVPHLEQHWLDALTEVYKTGKSLRRENYTADLDRWFTYQYSRIGGTGSRAIAVVFNDITERKQREGQQEFLIKFSDALRAEPDADAIANRALKMLADYLQLDRCYVGIALLNDDRALFPYQVGNDRVPTMPDGGVRLSDFPEALRRTFEETLVITDFQGTEGLTETEKQNFAALHFGALVVANARKDARNPDWSINAVSAIPRRWTALEIQLIEEVTERTWAAVETARAEEALRKSEEKYRTLFNSIDEGLLVQEVVTDVNGNVTDVIYQEVNRAFEHHSGMKDTVGKKASELLPHLKQSWLDALTQVYKTGKPIHAEDYAVDLNRWFTYQFSRVGEAGSELIGVVFNNITERKQRELQQAFLLNFSDELRTQPNADAIANHAIQLLFEHLQLDRCYIGVYRVADDRADLTHQVGNDRLPPMPAYIRLSDFPEAFKTILDGTLVVDDVLNKEGLTETDKQNMAAFGFGAIVAASLRKGEHNPQWAMVAVSATPRRWTANEIRLIEEVTERTWIAIEKANAEKALRESEERLQKVLSIETVGVIYFDLDGALHDANTAFQNMSGYSRADLLSGKVRWDEITPPEFLDVTLKSKQELLTAGLNTPYEKQYIRPDGSRWWGLFAGRRLNNREYVEFVVDITKSKEAEEALRESEERKEFLLQLNDTLRNLSDPVAIEYEAARLVAEKLEADRVHFAELSDEEKLVIRRDYVSGNAPSIVGVTKAKEIAVALKLERDEPVVIPDVAAFPLLTEEEKATLAAAKIRSQLSVALSKQGKKVASFSVDQTTPREWRPLEISILQEAAERTLAAVERAKAEAALRESEEKFASLFKASPAPSLILKPDAPRFTIIEVNEAYLRATMRRREDVVGQGMFEAFPDNPADTNSVGVSTLRASLERLLATRKDNALLDLKYDIPRPDGTFEERWWSPVNSPVLNELGEVKAIIHHVINVTERHRAEQALRKSEERFRTLADAVPQVIWTNDAGGNAVYFNQRWYEFTGLSHEESEGLGWQAIVHPDDGSRSIKKWQHALAKGEAFETEYRLRRKDGSYCWFIGRNVPVKDAAGNVTAWFGSATDIGNLKKTEEALSQSEERLRITMESATDYAIITMDTERKVERWSKGAEAIFGYTEEEMIGQSADIIFTQEDKAKNVPQQEMETARDTGRAPDERWHERKDGSRFFASGVMRPIQNKELTGYVKVMRDTTQERLFTEELHRLVAERTVELQRSNEDLRQFAHVASHDLKEPIRKIQTFNNRILDEYGDVLPPKAKTFAEKIGVSAERMISMIEGVLRYSKLGNAELVWEAVDLNEIVDQITSDLEVPVQQKAAVINKTNLPVIHANRTLLYQLFYNLVLNSLKFSKTDEPPHISVTAEPWKEDEKEFYRIYFSDNGIGFESEYAEDIFKTFTRLHPAEDYEGTGLGLALCRKIVERHGGRIWAESEPGKGATFTVLLPVL